MLVENERLEKFEKMLSAILSEYNDIVQKMECLKKENKTKTVTYRTLLGKKMVYNNMISMYEIYELIDK